MAKDHRLQIGTLLALLLCGAGRMPPAVFGSPVVFANAPVGASAPDSVTIGNGSVWIEYGNGASSTDYTGTSAIVQYSLTGVVQNTYQIPGSADGLKIDPSTGLAWVLQNQDANSRLTIINPVTNAVTSYTYLATSQSQGYDDIVFTNNNIYLSYTNPTLNTDPVIVTLVNRNSPLMVTPLVTYGASPATLNDPDSLKTDPSGNMVLTSGDDGALNFFSTSGAFLKSLSLNDAAGDPFSGVDDSFMPASPQGILFVTDTNSNNVYEINVSGLATGSIYAAVGNATINAIGQVDPITGAFTAIVSGLDRPHGLAFLATPEPGSHYLLAGGIFILVGSLAARKSRSKM